MATQAFDRAYTAAGARDAAVHAVAIELKHVLDYSSVVELMPLARGLEAAGTAFELAVDGLARRHGGPSHPDHREAAGLAIMVAIVRPEGGP